MIVQKSQEISESSSFLALTPWDYGYVDTSDIEATFLKFLHKMQELSIINKHYIKNELLLLIARIIIDDGIGKIEDWKILAKIARILEDEKSNEIVNFLDLEGATSQPELMQRFKLRDYEAFRLIQGLQFVGLLNQATRAISPPRRSGRHSPIYPAKGASLDIENKAVNRLLTTNKDRIIIKGNHPHAYSISQTIRDRKSVV